MLSRNPEVIAAFKRRHRIGAYRQHNRGQPVLGQRNFPAGETNRLLADWTPCTATGDAEIRFDIVTLRERSRQLERADPLMKRWLSCLEKNVLKPGIGFSLQNKALNAAGMLDTATNQKVEDAWNRWALAKNCTETGEETLYEVTRLALRSAARDGGVLVQMVRDPGLNEFGFALRLLEIDMLDVSYTVALANGNRIVMGVEKNSVGRTVAYHLLKNHPGDTISRYGAKDRVRVDAADVIHYFVKERVTQCVGVPWAAPSMIRMHHLEQYEIAELIASREAANKGGYFTSERGNSYVGEAEEVTTPEGTEKTGATISRSEPGSTDELPPGMSFVPYDPTHPTQQFGDFVRDSKLAISAGLDVSYASLVGDLTRSSFSSMRTGWLDERETYKKMQHHMIQHLMLPVFENFMEMGITTKAVSIPMSRMEQSSKPNFRGRRWPWVDPEKDVRAKLEEINAGLATRDAVIDESDSELDLEETFRQLSHEQKLAKKLGLSFTGQQQEQKPKNGAPPKQDAEPAEPDEDDAED